MCMNGLCSSSVTPFIHPSSSFTPSYWLYFHLALFLPFFLSYVFLNLLFHTTDVWIWICAGTLTCPVPPRAWGRQFFTHLSSSASPTQTHTHIHRKSNSAGQPQWCHIFKTEDTRELPLFSRAEKKKEREKKSECVKGGERFDERNRNKYVRHLAICTEGTPMGLIRQQRQVEELVWKWCTLPGKPGGAKGDSTHHWLTPTCLGGLNPLLLRTRVRGLWCLSIGHFCPRQIHDILFISYIVTVSEDILHLCFLTSLMHILK